MPRPQKKETILHVQYRVLSNKNNKIDGFDFKTDYWSNLSADSESEPNFVELARVF